MDIISKIKASTMDINIIHVLIHNTYIVNINRMYILK